MIPFNETFEFTINETHIEHENKEFSTEVFSGVAALMHVMYISVTILAIGGNGMVCYIVLAHQRMRTVTNFFILNLAVGDILMACLCIPFGFVSNLLLQYWPFGAAMCVIVSYAQAVSVFVSAYTLISISIDRYIAIIYPLRPRMTRFQAKCFIAIVWIVALLTPLPTAVLSRLEPHPAWMNAADSPRYICTESWETPEQRYHYSMALMVLQFFFPFTVLLFTYSRIAVVVWGSKPPGEAEDVRDQRLAASKRKMVRMMIVVVSAFSLCWLPLNVLIVVGDQDDRIWQYEHIGHVWFACHWLAMSHAAYNPLIYCWMSDRFRDGFKRACHCFLCSRKRTSQSSTPLHRRDSYTAFSSIRGRIRNDRFENSPTPSTKLTARHVCRYDDCSVDEDAVSDSAV